MGLNMSDEELEQDELEGVEDDDGEELPADGSDIDDDEVVESDERIVPTKKAKASVDIDELPSIEAKQKDRDALARAMEEFLARGGKVQEVEANVVADPPKKPDSKYGSRPI